MIVSDNTILEISQRLTRVETLVEGIHRHLDQKNEDEREEIKRIDAVNMVRCKTHPLSNSHTRRIA